MVRSDGVAKNFTQLFRFPSDSGIFIPKKTCCLSNNKGNIQKLIMMADWFRNNRLINLPDWLLTYVIDEKIGLTNTPGISIQLPIIAGITNNQARQGSIVEPHTVHRFTLTDGFHPMGRLSGCENQFLTSIDVINYLFGGVPIAIMKFPTEWKNNPFMFQTTNQLLFIRRPSPLLKLCV